MRYIEAPNPYDPDGTFSLFVGGGITGAPDWQMEMVKLLEGTALTLLNPRRKGFDVRDPNASRQQIEWEHRALKAANAICFWFPKEALCMITLYELGAWSMSGKTIFVGVEPGYVRQEDVEIQTKLARSEVKIAYSLRELAVQVKESWICEKFGGSH